MPPISVTVRLKDAEDITITVKPWQRVFESVLKGLDPNQQCGLAVSTNVGTWVAQWLAA